QQPDFFPATLAENLSIGNPFATADDIRRALDLADCRAEIDSWPQGIDTPVTAGQTIAPDLAARLSLARAYVQNANILLVDELPPSVMNATAGRRLREYISSSRGQRTVVIATHRGDL